MVFWDYMAYIIIVRIFVHGYARVITNGLPCRSLGTIYGRRLSCSHSMPAFPKVSGILSRLARSVNIISRLAFVTLKNNLMVLSLRAMMVQFAVSLFFWALSVFGSSKMHPSFKVLMMIAAFCFCGFLYALWTYVNRTSIQRHLSWWLFVHSSLSRNQAGWVALWENIDFVWISERLC